MEVAIVPLLDGIVWAVASGVEGLSLVLGIESGLTPWKKNAGSL